MIKRLSQAAGFLVLVAFFVLSAGGADAAALDRPVVTAIESGTAKIEVTVTAGASGAPGGFTVWWATLEAFTENGNEYPSTLTGRATEASFTGIPVVNVYPGIPASFQLGQNEAINIQIGDLFDETGIVASDYSELRPGTEYVLCVFANAHEEWEQSGNSNTLVTGTSPGDDFCHRSHGHWKNHPSAWPVSSLTLGSVLYTASELVDILQEPSGGNGLVILAHQLIAAKLNILIGADPAPVAAAITVSDGLIGSLVIPPVGAGWVPSTSVTLLAELLDDFNNDLLDSGCGGTTATEETSWGALKESFRR
ncbi:MAG: hypothetical protein HKN20_01655 [Gemmatimonadetes bacterium]|nr:hypothetical protein [Gemmatimonadota bacterium]